MNTSLLLFSGGPDSTSVAYLLKKEINLLLFTIYEPNRTRNHSEVHCATKIAEALGLPHKIVNISSTNDLFDGVERIAIGLGGGNRPGKVTTSVGFTKDKCVSPGRNEAPLSLPFLHLSAAIYAATHDVNEVIWGVHKDDDIPGGWIDSYILACSMSLLLLLVWMSLFARRLLATQKPNFFLKD